MNVFSHSGDLGDCLASLPTIRQLGGGRLILGNRNGRGARELMTKERFEVIAPLLREQEYVSEVIYQDDPSDVTHDFHHFRTKPPPQGKGCGELGYNLATWQAHWFGIAPRELDLSPWLKVTPGSWTEGWTVVDYASLSRSLRYRNPGFPWATLLQEHCPARFVGLQEEYDQFSPGGAHVNYTPTDNLLQVAQLIAVSRIFIGNQSAPMWVALGLGHPLIQEMDQCPMNRNSVVERDNAQYIA
jgi:hypothetical protein